MKKLKFKVQGMNCNSCAALIEAKLENRPGIISSKVSFDSQKATIVYDESQITEENLIEIIKSAGDFKLEKIEDQTPILSSQNTPASDSTTPVAPDNRKKTGILNAVLSITILSIALNIILAMGLSQQISNSKDSLKATAGTAINQNAQAAANIPSADNTAGSGQTLQTFEIKSTDHIRGSVNAPITLVEFSDFQCPYCGQHYPTLKKILNDYQGKVRLVYKHFPLTFHQFSEKAAEASECASEQGKFWEYHDKLFENQQNLSAENLKQWAKDLALNSSQFNNCLDSGKYASKVQADYNEGQQKGVNGTPATFVNGKLISGAVPYNTLKTAIDAIINQ